MNDQETHFYESIADADRVSGIQFQNDMQKIQHQVDSDLGFQHAQRQVNLGSHSRGLSIMESKELRRKAIMDDDLVADDYKFGQRNVNQSQGDLTLEMLSGAMPKKALENFEASPQHPGDSSIVGNYSDIPRSRLNFEEEQTQDWEINQNQNQRLMNRPQPQQPQYGFDDDFSVDQFKKNNAQLSEILMQLQTPQFDLAETNQRAPQQTMLSHKDSRMQSSSSTSKFNNHLATIGNNSGQTHKSSDPRGSLNLESGQQEVSQFSYNNQDHTRHYQQQNYYDQAQRHQDKVQMLQNAISNQKAQFPQHPPSQESTNYRKTFQPQKQESSQSSQRPHNMHNPAFQNAAQTMLDQKENYNQKNMYQQRRGSSNDNYNDDYTRQHSMQQSQHRQAQEFTLQPKQQQIQPNHQESKGNLPLAHAHTEVMKHFEDIPISQIQKMTGYQTHPKDYGVDKDFNPLHPVFHKNVEKEEEIEVDVCNLALGERVLHTNWRVRLEAYKEINQLFYSDYAKYESGQIENNSMSSFDTYGPLLQEMITDTNLGGLYEALTCLHSYLRFATSIKSVSFATQHTLLEKIQTNKPNFKEITCKILLTMLRRDQASVIYPELIKRFKNKNAKAAYFALFVVNEALKTNTAVEEINLKATFRSIQEGFKASNLPIRELCCEILSHIYRSCGDDVQKVISQCKTMRPVQIKEQTEILSKLEKNPRFSKNMLFDQIEEEPSQTKDNKEATLKQDQKTQLIEEKEATIRERNNQTISDNVDLLALLPDNFSEVVYLTQINAKKKVMEQFNAELTKLVGRKNLVIKNKDYTVIYNTAIHMLEDKNMLVYLEAIRNVELLSMLLGQQLKPKVKQFINLIANKYGEAKTAVVAAVDKGLLALVRNSYSPVLFADQCINQLAQTHKNPKVKQMLIEHALDQLVISLKDQVQVVQNMFKTVKDKTIQLILKDTNASVRDACVLMLKTFKSILPDDQSVKEAIGQLPKYRVSEITKKLSDESHQTEEDMEVPTKLESVDEIPVSDKPQFSKSLSQKLAQVKKPDPTPQMTFAQALIREARGGQGLSSNFSHLVQSILDQFGRFKENDFTVRYDMLEPAWNEILLRLGEVGLVEVRPVLIKAAHQLIMSPMIQISEHQGHFKSILAFTKRLFVLHRSIERDQNGNSEELSQYIRISLLQNQWIPNNQKETCQMLTVAMHATGNAFELNEKLRDVVDEPQMLLSPSALQIIEAVYVWLGTNLNMFMARGLQIEDLEELRGFGIKYLEGSNMTENQRQALVSVMIKFKDLVSFQKAEIEKMRQVHRVQVSVVDEIKEEDEQARRTTSSRQATPQLTQQHINAQEINQRQSSRQGAQQTMSSVGAPQTAAFRKESIGEHEETQQNENKTENSIEESDEEEKDVSANYICKMIDQEFEKGLLLFKDLAQNEPSLSFETKKQIFEKLLSIVSEGFKVNQQQQYKQAYALKALMWMKEETLGVEDCFKLTQRVMDVYSTSEMDGNDSTVELYLLNFWTKELSFRDLCDRISLCVMNQSQGGYKTNYSNFTAKQSNQMDQQQIDLFNCLFEWFEKTRLFPEKRTEDEEWEIQDLRKIAFPLAYAVLDSKSERHQVCKQFIKKTIEKLGEGKIREFMEIQLIHQPELYQRFQTWFEQSSRQRILSATSKQSVPKVPIDKLVNPHHSESKDQISQSSSQMKPTGNTPRGNTPRGLSDSGIHSYKERRDMHKKATVTQEKEMPHSKQYEDIISKIEHNLHQVKQVQRESKKIDESKESEEEEDNDQTCEPLRKTNTSAYYLSIEDKAKRYEVIADSPRSQRSQISNEEAPAEKFPSTNVIRDNLEMSELKSKHWKDKIRMLEEEKRRIENQSDHLMKEKNEQSDLWRSKVQNMEQEHSKVIQNLNEMNDQYSRQMDENEKLRQQLNKMQQQHAQMMSRFEEIEKRINNPKSPQHKRQKTPERTPDRVVRSERKDLIVSVTKLQRIQRAFEISDVDASSQLMVIQKIQELLLSCEKNVDGELAQPLICHYQKLKSSTERMAMIAAVRESLDENEDVLMALSNDVYKALLNFLLRAFSFEKQVLERQSMDKGGQDQNEITMESQRMVSKLLNSKEFTVSLLCLFQLLRESMPSDLAVMLTVEQRQYLRVIMRCIQRITKALHSEQPDLVRAFDVLLEMQKMFVKHPPEQLREDLPCLADFDFIYRGMKDVSDKMIDLQPDKVQSFLSFMSEQPSNAFIKYLRSVTASQY